MSGGSSLSTLIHAYDVNGNRNTTGYTVGTGGTLSASPNATYAYDSAVHVTAKTDTATGKITTFAYDYRDRLTGATRKTSGSVVDYQVTYTYDALNRRIGEQIDADGAGSGTPVQTWTVFDGQNPYADFTGSGTLNDRYLYGPAVDSLLARTDTSGVTDWYLADRLGSVRDIVDVSGTVVYHTGYDSFGNKVSSSGSGGDRFGFTGREHDAALNLYYNRARFYDPATGRFLSRDPIGFSAGDMNLYRYVNNSPTNGSDPSGKQPGSSPEEEILNRRLPGEIISAKDTNRISVDYGTRQIGSVNSDSAINQAIDIGLKLPEDIIIDARDRAIDRLTGGISDEVGKGLGVINGNGLPYPGKFPNARVKKLEPVLNTPYPHTVFKSDPKTGIIKGYVEFDSAGRIVKRFRGVGNSHGGINPPIVYESKPGKGPGSPVNWGRVPKRDELPKGY